MSILKIRLYGDSILKRKCRRIEKIGSDERRLWEEMLQTMREAKGIGLAAPQVGKDLQLIVIDAGEKPLKLANPRILERKGLELGEEGCLSIPGIFVELKRAKWILLEGLNEGGELIRLEAEGLLARALQHEIDHINAILITDYLNWFKRLKFRGKLREIKKRSLN